jgi:hypothetical protein
VNVHVNFSTFSLLVGERSCVPLLVQDVLAVVD